MTDVLEPVTVVWEHMDEASRKEYERVHGYMPPGYRGTGPVEWFRRVHPDEAPCVLCGVTTDQFALRETYIGTGGLPSATYQNHALCGVMAPICKDCTRRESIATLEKRQQNATIDEALRIREAVYLAELRSELNREAA